MKDWKGLQPDLYMLLTKHFTSGRPGGKLKFIVLHYNAANLTVEGCHRVWQTRAASAHYQVEDGGRIGQLVRDRDTAWHAGNWSANVSSIGIEHANRPDGTVSDACLEAGAHLVAAICLAYGLGRPEWGVNVYPHRHFSATSCPGQLAGSQRDRYMRRAGEWYDAMASGNQAAAPAPAPKPAPAPAPKQAVAVDGLWGSATSAALQRIYGTPVDGEVWHQWAPNRSRLPGLTTGWGWDRTGTGSPLIRAMQRDYGIEADGLAGPEFANAVIRRFGNGVQDGRLDAYGPAIKGLQRWINTKL